jgi:SAM-dependent methyltransferase
MPMEIINRAKIIKRALSNHMWALWQKPASCYQQHRAYFLDKKGIEIGGPSQVFSKNGIFPVYTLARHLDNCNFCNSTVWEGRIQTGHTFVFDERKSPGRQFIAEATELHFLPTNAYDFVLSSHVLEHIANPIRALKQWIGLLKNEGLLVLLLPDKHKTFDHRRPVTILDHLIEDYENQIAEDDLTHLPEILSLHDLSRDPEAGNFNAFKARALDNINNRCLHHHVFDVHSAAKLMKYTGLRVEGAEEVAPHHILILGRKSA